MRFRARVAIARVVDLGRGAASIGATHGGKVSKRVQDESLFSFNLILVEQKRCWEL